MMPGRARGVGRMRRSDRFRRAVLAGYLLLAALVVGYLASILLRPSGEEIRILDQGLVTVIELGASLLCLANAMVRRVDRRVSVALGELTTDDVAVEVVYGRPDDADEIIVPAYATLTPEPSGAVNGVVRYSGEVSLDQPGPFGYTVRVLPNHPLLDSRAELGLVTYPQAPAGMTNGDLRLPGGARGGRPPVTIRFPHG